MSKMPVNRMLNNLKPSKNALPFNQRGIVRSVKNLPPEALPLVVIVIGAIGGGTFAMAHKILTDKGLRTHPTHPTHNHQ